MWELITSGIDNIIRRRLFPSATSTSTRRRFEIHFPCQQRVSSDAMSDSDLLNLNCWVHGDERQSVFTVKIPKTDNVSTLKKLIKDEKKPIFDHIPADSLVLWKDSVPIDELDKLKLKPDGEALSPVDELSELFSDKPARKCVHIVVRPPPAGE